MCVGRLAVEPDGDETSDSDEPRGKGTGRGGSGPGFTLLRRGSGELLLVRGVGDAVFERRSCHMLRASTNAIHGEEAEQKDGLVERCLAWDDS
jgi:hypothetical protein